MGALSIKQKTILETVLDMKGGFVLDFSNASFEQFFEDLGIDIFDERYANIGTSKANRLRAFWQLANKNEIAKSVLAFCEYIQTKQETQPNALTVSDEQLARLRDMARELGAERASKNMESEVSSSQPSDCEMPIAIHPDIHAHIQPFMENDDYFHAVEEAYKIVREKLRELTGKERATDVFNPAASSDTYHREFYGETPTPTEPEKDFRVGVGHLHLGIQFLRNENMHSLARPLEPNLAIHYIALASLAYDLITRHLDEDVIQQIEDLVTKKRKSYRSVDAFYDDFEHGKWISSLSLPRCCRSVASRRILKAKWIKEADLTRSWNDSNIVLMRLELVVTELSDADLDQIVALPTKDKYGYDQQAGMIEFLEYVAEARPGGLTANATTHLAKLVAEARQ